MICSQEFTLGVMPEPMFWFPLEEPVLDYQDTVSGVPADALVRTIFGVGASITADVGKVANSSRLRNGNVPPFTSNPSLVANNMASFVRANGVTVAFWAKWKAFSNTVPFYMPTFILNAGLGTVEQFQVTFFNNQLIVSVQQDSHGISADWITVAFVPVLEEWYFFRVYYDPVSGKFGIQVDDGATTESVLTLTWDNPSYNFAITFQLGNALSNPGQDWELDEIAIFGKKLTDAEIAMIYNDGNGVTYPFS